MPSDPGSGGRSCRNLLKKFWESFGLKVNKKKNNATPVAVSHRSGNVGGGLGTVPSKGRGCSSTPCRRVAAAKRQLSPALPPPRQTGRDSPRAGGRGKGPPSP